MRYLCVLLMLMLASCASTREPEIVWVKPGATDAEARAEFGQCRAQAMQAPSLMQIALANEACLVGKGWEQKRK